jgi:hypothetical protein
LLGVRFSQLIPFTVQMNLFDNTEEKLQLYQAVDALKNQFGSKAVTKATVLKNPDLENGYYLIAGEASGDLHGSNLMKELKKRDAEAAVRCWGGDGMQAAGATVVKHYKDLAFMGFAEVVKNLPTILRNIRFCKEDIAAFKPDVLVLIDYPGFNLRIARWAKEQGYKVIYYISPQVWAWKESRVKTDPQCSG